MTDNKPDNPTPKPAKIGLINRRLINTFLFSLVAGSLLISVFVVIFATWDYVGTEFAYKTATTCATLIFGGVLFSFINDYFGKKMSTSQQPLTQES